MQGKLIRLAAAAILALVPAVGFAQVEAGQSQIDVFVGSVFGDDLTDGAVSGTEPELDDDVVFGVRYTYQFTADWGIEFQLGLNTNTAVSLPAGIPGGEIDMDVFTLDIDAIYNFNPESTTVWYVVFGAGFAQADLDSTFTGTFPSGGPTVTIDDDNGFTLNGGGGVKFFINDGFLIRADARFRFVDALVDMADDSLTTVEATVGVAWAF